MHPHWIPPLNSQQKYNVKNYIFIQKVDLNYKKILILPLIGINNHIPQEVKWKWNSSKNSPTIQFHQWIQYSEELHKITTRRAHTLNQSYWYNCRGYQKILSRKDVKSLSSPHSTSTTTECSSSTSSTAHGTCSSFSLCTLGLYQTRNIK